MRGDEREPEPLRYGAVSVGDLSFAVFSLTHAGCGEDGVIELRLNERLLLGWCPSCAALETFGSPDLPPANDARSAATKRRCRRPPMARR
jgi:hypothetical protein